MSADGAPLLLHSSDGESLRARLLTAGDEAALRSFHDGLSPVSQSLFTPHGYDDLLLQRYVERCQRGQDRSYVLLDHSQQIIGYFFLWDFTDRVPSVGIGIADSWQGKKLGSQMMQILIDDARSSGRDGIDLTTMLDNHRAYALYEKLGFVYLGKVENVAADGRVVIEKEMFLALKQGAEPSSRDSRPPV
jgi:ribosomal protein S18 acetylase RimI-like enzyme